jgi:gliding motility-associated-like protein
LNLKRILSLLWLCLSLSAAAQHVAFVENEGQWQGDFDYLLRHGSDFLFFKPDEVRVQLLEKRHTGDEIHHHQNSDEVRQGHVYSMQWLGVNLQAEVSRKVLKDVPYLNYLKGKDPQRWKAGLRQYQEIVYHNIYPNIDLRYYLSSEGVYKYDFIVKPGGDPSEIRWQFKGVESYGLTGEDLALITAVKNVVYTAPLAFQEEDLVKVAFQQEGQLFKYVLGDYDRSRELIIDPTLVFSTYSASTDDNFGFSATFGVDGAGYNAGINYVYGAIARGFPTTLGAFQDSSSGGVLDGVIAKYSPDGSQQIYATFLGGAQNDVPISLLEGPDKSLIILGATGSPDFPVTLSAFDTSFSIGPAVSQRIGGLLLFPFSTDIFLSILDSTGGSLLGSTYLGGAASDGMNNNLEFNYGDASRGDLSIDSTGNILGVSFTFSPNIDTGSALNSNYAGLQDGIVFSFNSDLSQLNWNKMIGGSNNDAVFSLRFSESNRLFITGATESTNLTYPTTGAYQDSANGKVDGFLAELNPTNGDVLKFTYTGTAEHDVSYFLDIDRQDNITIFGQTRGAWPQIGDSLWGQPGSAQFLQQFSPDLKLNLSTTFGVGTNFATNISPGALMVSECGDVFLSGWGAGYGSARGNAGTGIPANMPITANAWRDSTDRGDFYFLRMDASWKRLEYATFFGQYGFGADHVDGGSSRFRKDGSIFQAVCSCGFSNSSFPTTPNAFSAIKMNNRCNMAIFRFDMKADSIDALVDLAPGYADTVCFPSSIKFADYSFNADWVLVQSPDGTLDTLRNQLYTMADSGINRFTFYAIDTNCFLIDSTFLEVFALGTEVTADFSIDYDSCDQSALVSFVNQSSGSSQYRWTFGDGDSTTSASPSHNYSPGTYQVEMIAFDPICQIRDTLSKTLIISQSNLFLELISDVKACAANYPQSFRVNQSGFHLYSWYLNDQLLNETSDSLILNLEEGGNYTIRMQAFDTICNNTVEREESIFIYDEEFLLELPNIFSPNGDGQNDFYGILGNEKTAAFVTTSALEIRDRNGVLLFNGDGFNERWDGNFNNQEMAQGVYFYLFNYQDICGNIKEAKGFLHLQR